MAAATQFQPRLPRLHLRMLLRRRWFLTHNTSPLSNAPLPHKNLIPNHNLRSTIMEFKQNAGRQL